MTTTVAVPLGDRSYDVLVGRGARHELATLLPAGARLAAVVTQPSIPWTVDPGIESKVFTIPDGEDRKTLSTVEELCSGFAAWGLTRGDVVVAVGGGLVTDLAGFAASMYHRGVAVVHVATTLLAQVDAAIGGKTGVNLPEGKNLVGAYWQPHGVLCDTETLDTLPPRELRNGHGEMAKYAFLGAPDLIELDVDEQVAACVRVKADVVSSDEREGGRRMILNYGHTLGHAIEKASGFDLRHGEAVAIGVVFAAELARRLGRIDDARVAEHRRVVGAYDLPMTIPPGLDLDHVRTLIGRDKKKASDGVVWVLDGPNGVEPVTGVDPTLVDECMEAIS